ncbi:MAG: hypothetical protein ABH832_02150 [bacterium]
MPLKQLQIVEKIKSLVSNIVLSKKQIVDEAKKNAEEHRLINQKQEREDKIRIEHAVKELQQEDKKTG